MAKRKETGKRRRQEEERPSGQRPMIVLFEGMANPDVIAHVEAGGQALELWDKSYIYGPTAPLCFRGKDFAKLYDMDAIRLTATARRLGVNVIKIDRPDTNRQHIDLVGGPMRKAIKESVKQESLPKRLK